MADHGAFGALLESLYAATLEPQRLEEFCARLAGATGSHIGAIMVQDVHRHGGRLDLVVGADPVEAARYEREFAADNLWVRRSVDQLATGAVLDSDDFVPRGELRRSRYYNEYLRTGDVEQSVALCAHFDGRNVVTATVCRSGRLPAYSARQLELIRQVAPHWVNAYAIMRRLEGLQERVSSLEAALEQTPTAMFALASNLRLLRANASGERLLSQGVLHCALGRLSIHGWQDVILQQLLSRTLHSGARAGDAERLVLKDGDGNSLALTAHPLPPPAATGDAALFVFVQPLGAPVLLQLERALQQLFGLTEPERRLAVALLRHADLALAAQECGIALSAAQTRLKVVFDKTGERSQPSLMRLLAALHALCP
ncbi:hypothetical protein [Pseudoxanthomonas putridarboris]|uniref:DNA-binding transcriptional regulator, CsgD family n=1 Tax=Pseudoxanthomonas putridarboris TaxID=752605 RepID=A0ABU9J4M4_9GAMM